VGGISPEGNPKSVKKRPTKISKKQKRVEEKKRMERRRTDNEGGFASPTVVANPQDGETAGKRNKAPKIDDKMREHEARKAYAKERGGYRGTRS